LFGIAGAAQAQDAYPDKPVRVVVGFPPGTTADFIARLMAPKMREGFGRQFIVENRAGAGSSSIAAEAVARAPADGSTLLVSTIANAINPSLFKLSFDFAKDLAPVALLAETPGLLIAHPSAPSGVRELVAAAKAKPGEIAYGSSGNGTVTHLWGELFNLASGTRLTLRPLQGKLAGGDGPPRGADRAPFHAGLHRRFPRSRRRKQRPSPSSAGSVCLRCPKFPRSPNPESPDSNHRCDLGSTSRPERPRPRSSG
jgi:hypothetical protein